MDESQHDIGGSPPKLPMELTDAILDQLHDDIPTLLTCSVICSSWLQATRYHLFYSLRINNTQSGRTFSDFLAFIKSSPDICVYIHSLGLQGDGADATQCIGPFLLSQILQRLPCLRNLELDNVIWERAYSFGENGEPILASWPRLDKSSTSLVLRRFRSDRVHGRTCLVNDIFEALSTFSSLRSLKLERIKYSRIMEPPSENGVPRLRLEELDISAPVEHGSFPDQDFFNTLRAKVSLHDLSRVFVRCICRTHVELAGSFVEDVNLTDLSLDLSNMEELAAVGNESIWSSLNLASLTSLKALTLHVWTSGTHLFGDVFTFTGQWCLCSVSPILSHTSPTVERVTIVLSVSGDPSHLRGHLECLDWRRLQNEFSRLDALESVVFEIRQRSNVNVGDEATSAVAALVENKLSALVSRGLLEVI